MELAEWVDGNPYCVRVGQRDVGQFAVPQSTQARRWQMLTSSAWFPTDRRVTGGENGRGMQHKSLSTDVRYPVAAST